MREGESLLVAFLRDRFVRVLGIVTAGAAACMLVYGAVLPASHPRPKGGRALSPLRLIRWESRRSDGVLTTSGTVQRVVDGDTVQLQSGVSVRLVGVDAPEVAHMGRHGEWLGPEATAYLRHRVEGRQVRLRCELGNLIDRYGRLLAFVYLDDALINGELIEKGYAFAYERYSHLYVDRFRELQEVARAAERGLWQG